MSQIIGHRGASKERPENTMAAFVRAHELGACGIEIDVHAILGDAVIIHHDGKLGRCVSAPESSIYTYDAKTIKKYSAGEYFSPLYKNERIPLLCELLEYLQGNDMYLNVEVKNDSGFLSEVGELTVNLLERYNMLGRCIISSFDHGILKSIKNKHPKYKVGILYSSSHCINVVEYCKSTDLMRCIPIIKRWIRSSSGVAMITILLLMCGL